MLGSNYVIRAMIAQNGNSNPSGDDAYTTVETKAIAGEQVEYNSVANQTESSGGQLVLFSSWLVIGMLCFVISISYLFGFMV